MRGFGLAVAGGLLGGLVASALVLLVGSAVAVNALLSDEIAAQELERQEPWREYLDRVTGRPAGAAERAGGNG